MNTKIILFDIDGVIIRPPYYYGKVLEDAGYTDAENILNNFFIHENTDCTEGGADISEKIIPYLEQIGWQESIEEFFRQQFEFEAGFIDGDFLEYIKGLQSQGYICYLASAQENIRAKYFLKTVGLGDIFDGSYISCNVGYRKDKPEYWKYTIADLQKKYLDLKTSEIAFFDDGKKNIEVALGFGINAFLFTDMQQFCGDIISINSKNVSA